MPLARGSNLTDISTAVEFKARRSGRQLAYYQLGKDTLAMLLDSPTHPLD